MTANVSISRDNLYALLSGMSLSDRRWLVEALRKQMEIDEAEAEARWKKLQEGTPLWKDDYKESYDEVFASFNKDWGGDGDALEIARSIREENAMTRTVDTWWTMLTHGKYLLDTDVCIALIKGQHGIQERIRDIDPMDIKISDITLAELYFGAYKSGR